MRLTYRSIKKAVLGKGYKFFSGVDSVNIVGIRTNDSTNKFSDHVCVCWIDSEGKQRVLSMPATTKAGRHWLLSPLHKKGTAILIEGQYRGAYKIGIHNRSRPSRSYKALEQKVSMRYFRDNNGDSVHDYTGPIYEGNFKTNIHRSGKSGWSSFVDKWSAGCQVITGINPDTNNTNWSDFMEVCEMSAKRYGNSFTYTLLNENDFNT